MGQQYAVVVPVERDQPVTVIEWHDDLKRDVYPAIGSDRAEVTRASEPKPGAVLDVGIWTDDMAALRPDGEINERATAIAGHLVMGTAILTRYDPNDEGDTPGFSRSVAERVPVMLQYAPLMSDDERQAEADRMREMAAAGPVFVPGDYSVADFASDEQADVILCTVLECPECHTAVMAKLGDTLTGCSEHAS